MIIIYICLMYNLKLWLESRLGMGSDGSNICMYFFCIRHEFKYSNRYLIQFKYCIQLIYYIFIWYESFKPLFDPYQPDMIKIYK